MLKVIISPKTQINMIQFRQLKMCSTIIGMTDYRYRSLIKLQLIHSHRDNLKHYHPYMIGIHKTGPCPKFKFKGHKKNLLS